MRHGVACTLALLLTWSCAGVDKLQPVADLLLHLPRSMQVHAHKDHINPVCSLEKERVNDVRLVMAPRILDAKSVRFFVTDFDPEQVVLNAICPCHHVLWVIVRFVGIIWVPLRL